MTAMLAPLGLEDGPVLGRGRTTLVLGAHRADGSVVAVKVPREPGDAATARRLRHEAEVLRRLHHPHLVPFLDLLEPDPSSATCGLVMPIARGGTLAGLLSSCGALPDEQGRALVRQLADALGHVHAQGVVHGDLKPANVLLPTRRTLWLADFDRASVGSRRAGAPRAGTAGYVAPEVDSGGEPSPASDVFGAALTAVELLTGRRPTDRAHASALLVGTEPATRDTLLAALSPDPAHRPRDGAELRVALDGPTCDDTVEYGPRPPPHTAPSRPTRQRPIVALAGAASLVGATVIGTGALVLRAPVPITATATTSSAVSAPAPSRCASADRVIPAGRGTSLRWAVLPGQPCARPVVWHPDAARLDVGATVDPATAGLHFTFGQPGDSLLLGDWDRDGTDEPALYRPTTGEVFRFDGWATPEAPRPNASVESTGVLEGRVTVLGAPDGADRIAVAR